MNKELTKRPVILEVFCNREKDYTFKVSKSFNIGKANKVIIICKDINSIPLKVLCIQGGLNSGLKTYNDTIDLAGDAPTLRSKNNIRTGIINSYKLKTGQKIIAEFTSFCDGTHLYELVIPVDNSITQQERNK